MRLDGRLTVREFLGACLSMPVLAQRWEHEPASSTAQVSARGANIEVEFGGEPFDLKRDALLAWIEKAAKSVAAYYGVFPVPTTRLRVNCSERRTGVFSGTTWGSTPPFTRISVGRHTTQEQLDQDWMLTHEMVHLAFPDVADEHHWIEEGIATYVEPVARVQTGELKPESIWADMVRDMPKGEPGPDDRGLDNTHTWGRTYWGGALFCLQADVAIRQQTSNSCGLQDALRAIRKAGGTIQHDWPLTQALRIGDAATSTTVLTDLYMRSKDAPAPVDLDALWSKLGVLPQRDSVSFNDNAPLAAARRAITQRR